MVLPYFGVQLLDPGARTSTAVGIDTSVRGRFAVGSWPSTSGRGVRFRPQSASQPTEDLGVRAIDLPDAESENTALLRGG